MGCGQEEIADDPYCIARPYSGGHRMHIKGCYSGTNSYACGLHSVNMHWKDYGGSNDYLSVRLVRTDL